MATVKMNKCVCMEPGLGSARSSPSVPREPLLVLLAIIAKSFSPRHPGSSGPVSGYLYHACGLLPACPPLGQNRRARASGTWREMVLPTPPLPLVCGLSPCSEIEAQAQLDLTRIVRLGGKHAKCLRALQAHRRIQEANVVKQVEELRGERQPGLLRQLDFLHETYVHVPRTQTSQRAATRGGVRAELDRPKEGAHSPRIGENV